MKTILLCGNSIPLAGLAAFLSRQSDLTVIQSDLDDLTAPPGPDHIVIVDTGQAAEAFALLLPHPIWRLLCVDGATGTLTACTAHSRQVQELEEIARYVREVAQGKQINQ